MSERGTPSLLAGSTQTPLRGGFWGGSGVMRRRSASSSRISVSSRSLGVVVIGLVPPSYLLSDWVAGKLGKVRLLALTPGIVLAALPTGLDKDMRALVHTRQPLLQIRTDALGQVPVTFDAPHTSSLSALCRPAGR